MKVGGKLLALIVVFLAVGSISQYFLIQMYTAGQRQTALVCVTSFAVAIIVALWQHIDRSNSTWKVLGICVGAPMVAAYIALLAGEKFDSPEVSVLLRSDGLKVAGATLMLAGGWLIGIFAFFAVSISNRIVRSSATRII